MNTRRSVHLTAAALALAGFGAVGSAHADVAWSVGIAAPGVAVGFGAPVPIYVAPPPVYVAPPPVYVPPPPPVYVAPYPVYRAGWVQPYYYRGDGWRERREWREHHWHRHHDDDD
jgi:hypothetical protein